MILIITHKLDFTADFVINKLNQEGISYKRFNCEDLFDHDLTLNINDTYNYSILGEANYKSVWYRRTKLPEIKDIPHQDRIYILNEIDTFYRNLFSSMPSKWLSSPTSVHIAENKFLQLKVARQLGFSIPKTLITNSKIDLIRFFRENNNDIIIKPISQTRIDHNNNPAFIFTNKVSPSFIDQIDQYDLTPCIFQENIHKEFEIRVTVVDDKVFPAVVYSQDKEATKIDWRRKKSNFSIVEIPENVLQLCIKLVKTLNLSFGAIDLIKDINGNYIFLEINPNGQWAWIESETGLKISDAIVDFLNN